MTAITTQDVLNCATLSRLHVDENTAQTYADNLQKILAMMDILAQVNTDGIAPLANIHESCQVLRQDTPTTDIDRSANQSVAPAVQDGLYLVPQVIE
ncbi:MAG: Asp-tRNA(Asn)/Glu-tRNA(Gln) amidotransferase subunit GatC [Moraxella sp.]|nr:Asp-tRNA(Asn)/Glu-tRNA(Gln) amidotransferase subunit GatC [Moraxella sp.]